MYPFEGPIANIGRNDVGLHGDDEMRKPFERPSTHPLSLLRVSRPVANGVSKRVYGHIS